MWRDLKQLYADSAAFALALPILFSVPVVIEFTQHVVEIDLGLYQHGGAAAVFDQRRLTLGYAKVLALLLPGYWFVRYMAFDRDADRAKRIERPAATLFGVQFGLQAVWQWLMLFGAPLGIVLGLGPRAANYVDLIAMVAVTAAAVYLTAWLVAWPLGNAGIGPLRSVVIMSGSLWRTLAYLAAGTLPLMAVHYALGYAAFGQPAWLVWILMALGAFAVGFLALTSTGAAYLAARWASWRRGVSLIGGAAQ